MPLLVIDPLVAAGIGQADAAHLAAAVGLGADVFLTDDVGILKVIDRHPALVPLRVKRPSDFLVRAVRAGAPWRCSVDWPSLTLPGAES